MVPAAAGTSAEAACHPQPAGQDSFCSLPGARLHYVDWGGHGPALILLTGFGDTARIYDDFARRLTAHHHVIAVTRRGFGRSVAEDGAYDVATLSGDVIHLMDGLGIGQADLVGHSLAGNELTYIGVHFPARARRIVYIDAAYDFSKALTFRDPAPSREPGAVQLSSYAALTAWRQFELDSTSPAIAADIRELYAPGKKGLLLRSDVRAGKAVLAQAILFHPDYAKLRAPALALYAPKTQIEQPAPTFTKEDREKSVRYFVAHIRPWMLSQKRKFARTVHCGAAYEVPGVAHMMFIERPREVARIVESFLDTKNPCHPGFSVFGSK